MFEKRIEIQPGQTLTLVEMAADVIVSGEGETDVIVQMRDGQEQDLSVEQDTAGPAVSAKRECQVVLPGTVPVVVREARGSLKVRELVSLNAEQVRGNLKLSEVQDAVVAEVYGNLKASEVSSLRVVGTAHGDAHLSEVQKADLQNVRGNLHAKEVSTLRASQIGGNLVAKEVSTALEAGQVGGNAALKEIGGPIRLEQVAGNLAARELTAGAKVDRIGGNLALSGELGSGCTYQFKVDGNAVVSLEEDANLHVTVSAADAVVSSLALDDAQRTDKTLSGTLGTGGAELAIESGGNVVLSGSKAGRGTAWDVDVARSVEESLRAVDLEGIGRQVNQEVEAAMARLRVKMEGMDWERMGRHAQEAVERAMEHMQRDVDHLAERAARRQEWLERHAEREARRAERDAHRAAHWEAHFRGAAPATPGVTVMLSADQGAGEDAPPSSPPASNLDQERLSILKMVEQGQISPAEAGMLLDALE